MSTTEVAYRIFATLFPLFAITFAGYWYGRKQRPDLTFANQANMDIFAPALIFSALAVKPFSLQDYAALICGGAIVVLGSGLLCWPLTRIFRLNAKVFLPPMMFNNSGNLGIPLIVLALGDAMLPAAVMLFVVEMVLHLTVGLYYLDRRTGILPILRMPMILATIMGLIWSHFNWSIPKALAIPIDMLGAIAIPLMLVTLGVRISETGLKISKPAMIGAFGGPLAGVLCALIASSLLPLDEEQQFALILFGALPPAVLNYIIAERYQNQPAEVATIVMCGNFASLLILPVVLATLF